MVITASKNAVIAAEYNFSSSDSIYTLEQNIGKVEGVLNINGVANGNKKSTIDLNGYSGFVFSDATGSLNIKNTTFKNANGQVFKLTAGEASFENITFSENIFSHETSEIRGAAIFNEAAKITKLSGTFSDNHLSATSGSAFGGAISNDRKGYIESITNSLFYGNKLDGYNEAQGGAIWNSRVSVIGDITADFVRNEVGSESSEKIGRGGAIYNGADSIIGNIKGDFFQNKITAITAHGGAIHSDRNSQIKSITGEFKQNVLETVQEGKGAAIYNYMGQIGKISGAFIENSINSTSSLVRGGAIFNDKGTISEIEADFTGNYTKGNHAQGGAIQIEGYITNYIKGDFKNNYALGDTSAARGGAIYIGNNYSVGDIIGDFIGNYAKTNNYKVSGGAIHISPNVVLGDITGDFINNYISTTGDEAKGGALMFDSGVSIGKKNDNGEIVGGIINSSFKNNYAEKNNSSGNARGGAIYTKSSLNIIADNGVSEFSGNYIKINDEKKYEAIYVDNNNVNLVFKSINTGEIVLNDYVNGQSGYNVYLTGDSTGKIGLYNQIQNADVAIEKVVVDFINDKTLQYEFNTLSSAQDVIYNFDIDLTNNTADTIKTTKASSGIITVGGLNFLNQYSGTPQTIQLLFTQNSDLKLALSDNILIVTPYISNTIYNDQIITAPGAIELATTSTTNDSITVNGTIYDALQFLNTKQTSEDRSFIFRTLEDYNLSQDLGSTATGKINIEGVSKYFPSTINAQGHSLFELSNNNTELNISNMTITGAKAIQGAVINATKSDSVINLTNVSLVDNIATSENGAAIYSFSDVNITANASDIELSRNKAGTNSEAIYIADKDKTLTLNSSNGSKINLNDTINGKKGYKVKIKGSSDSFISVNNEIKNAQITMNDITMFLGDANSFATSDFTINSGRLNFINNSIEHHNMNSFVVNGDFTLDLDADLANATMDRLPENTTIINGSINVDRINLLSDSIKAETSIPFAYDSFKDYVKYVGSSELSNSTQIITAYAPIYKYSIVYNKETGDFVFSRPISNGEFSPPVTAPDNDEQNGSLTPPSTTPENTLPPSSSEGENGNINPPSDDNSSNDSGEILPPSSGNGSNNEGETIPPSDDNDSNNESEILPPSSGNGSNNESEIFPPSNDNDSNNEGETIPPSDDNNSNDSSEETDENTPSNDDNNNNSSSGESGSSSIRYENFNPAILTSSVAATVGGLGTMNYVMNYSFKNSSDYMNNPYKERQAKKNRNKYALASTDTNVGPFSPIYKKEDSGSLWMKPYTTFENVPLKNGPKVSNIMYGTLAGFDTETQSIKYGWDRTFTGYVGYNGASQRYSGIDSTLNGGLVGGTMTLYKGNFFNATTVNLGTSIVNSQTMYGNEEFDMLLSGIGNKMGYNFEFKDGKVILQPSMMASYTFVNVEDYTNAAGVRINIKPIHAVQLVPSAKIIANTKNNWQPYAAVSMIWNINGKSDVMANDVTLPQMSIKPYVQYGVGVQKKVKDNFTAYGQTMIQNGGRNGVSLTAGFRWALGKDTSKSNNKNISKKKTQSKISDNSNNKMNQFAIEL